MVISLFALTSIIAHGQTDSAKSTSIEKFTLEDGPEFPGGQKARINYLQSNIKLPKNWNPDSITGKVYIQFMVEANGSILNPKVFRGLDPVLDSLALNTIRNMPNWTPAKKNGSAETYILPIKFGTDTKKEK